ncbi:hypothetical protein ACSNOK_26400 [Streptomyces sp. URMC 126]|uniref:hypothetical protein n=1 Tax=Streptomyces sp. URMC 126 TaxID=3423401 RepID=UPI003F19FBBF
MSAALLTSCGVLEEEKRPALIPMPGGVPDGPLFADADAVVAALDKSGLPCRIVRRGRTDPDFGTGLDCVSVLNGIKFENQIDVANTRQKDYRDRNGDSIAARHKAPFSQTVVAAGNWYINVTEPRFAPRVAKALHGVVLPPEKVKIPDYPLPSIPDEPRYKSLGALADALGEVVGCDERSEELGGTMTCTTGKRTGAPNCATIALHATPADRDRTLREAIAYKGVPATLVAAGNWTVNLCDYGLGSRVAEALHGRVVAYDGS